MFSVSVTLHMFVFWGKVHDFEISQAFHGLHSFLIPIASFFFEEQVLLSRVGTPWKINMEPTNHPFKKENDLPNLHDYGPC